MAALKDFCNGVLWDYNAIRNTSTPDFTDCFQQTVLVWIPCIFLWTTIPYQILRFTRKPFVKQKIAWISIGKIVLSLILATLSVIDLGYVAHHRTTSGSTFPPSDLVAPIFKAIISAGYVLMDFRRGESASSVLCVFWFLMLISSSITFRSKLLFRKEKLKLLLIFTTHMIYFPLTVVQFVLSCFADRSTAHNDTNSCPERYSSLPNRLTFWWFTSLAYLGWKRPLTQSDLWEVDPQDRTDKLVTRLENNWYTGPRATQTTPPKKTRQLSLTNALVKTFWRSLLSSGALKVINDVLLFASPQLLRLLIGFVKDPSVESWKGYFYAVLLLLVAVLQTLILGQYFYKSTRIGMQVRSAVVAAVYRKALKITSAAKRSSTVGEIVNLMSVDSQKFVDLMGYIHLLWSGPLQIALSLYFLWQQLGPSVLAGLGVMIFMIPVNAYMAAHTRALQVVQMKEKDGRVKLITEILNGIKVLKFYAWEEPFRDQILGIRGRELDTLRKAAYLASFSSFTWTITPFLVTLVTFATYIFVSAQNNLDTEKAFVSLSLFNILRFPISMLPTVITSVVQANVSVNRLSKFLCNEELSLNNVRVVEKGEDSAIVVSHGDFSWSKDGPLTLSDISLDIQPGQLVAVVGTVGSGKSSLLAAMLGLMEKRAGDVAAKGTSAYVTQQAWIQNMTVRDNILFGLPFDAPLYDTVIDACALGPDLAILPAGDLTEIGEKGINLSGGQKQRVSLARAVYSRADIYFLDDPLSAVDSHVGKHLFDRVIGPNGILRHTTRILVTHGLGFLPKTDQIVVVDQGHVVQVGSFKQLISSQGTFSEMLQKHALEEEEAKDQEISEILDIKDSAPAPLLPQAKTPEKFGGNLIAVEKSEEGMVKWSVYLLYFRNMTYGASLGTLLFYVIYNGFGMATNIWLGEWTQDSFFIERNTSGWRDYRLGIYGALGGFQGIFMFISAIIMAWGQIQASEKLHRSMLNRILRAPMCFFETTPLGRIVNRFSKDVDTVDTSLPGTIRQWLNCVFQVLSTVVMISLSTPIFASLIIPLGLMYYCIQRFYVSTSRQLKRLESVSRSPIYSHFQESITGSSTIIATKQSDRFIIENERRVDVNNASYFASIVSQRWLAVRLETIGNLVTFFAALFAVISRDKNWGIDPKGVGLSISYALSVTQILNWMVRMASELENNVVSVERIKEYTEIPSEAEWVVPASRPDQSWPEKGGIKFVSYESRYRPELDLVLKDFTASVEPGEKVGVVGRTGAGKSSLTLALFRIIEASSGAICVDDRDISRLGLHDLRSRLTIIPQEPVLFSGTLRINLDPMDTYSDDEVWSALENAHLKQFVAALPDKLNHPVAEGGENLSVGQRQLVCLARALLRKTRILILDEATAAIDLQTDDLIQQTIRDRFANCTVLTIAHRLNTIMDSDRIMVLDQGLLKEFDTPERLLRDPNSLFSQLARDAGLLQ